MTEEMPPQGLLTATGFAAEKRLRCCANTTSRPRRYCFELVCRNMDLRGRRMKAMASPQRVSAIGQCRFLEYAAEAMDDSAFGLHLARQIDPRDVGLYFYAGSAARDLGEALALFSRYCRIVNEAFRLTQRSADTAIEFEFAGLPRYAARHNMEYVVAGIVGGIANDVRPQRRPDESRVRPQSEFRLAGIRAVLRLSGRVRRAEHGAPDLSRCSPPSADHRGSEAAPRPSTLLRCCCEGAERKTGTLRSAVEAEVEKLLPDGKAKAENVAEALALSLRTLARRLADEGTTYGEVVDQLRKSLATQYLNDPGMSLGQIAWLLGYEGSTSFNHAFKRWTGRSPSADRHSGRLICRSEPTLLSWREKTEFWQALTGCAAR